MITTNCLLSSIFFFKKIPWHFISKQVNTVYIKHMQVIKKIEKRLARSFSTLWDKEPIHPKIVMPPLCVEFFDTRNFQKLQSVSLRTLLVLWDKIFSLKVVIPSFMYEFYRYQKLSETPKGPPDEFFPLTRRVSDIFSVIPPLCFGKFFCARQISQTPRNFRRQRNRGKIVIPLLSCMKLLILKTFGNTKGS